jgi:hypothetical protein
MLQCLCLTVTVQAQLITPLSRELNLRIEKQMYAGGLFPFTVNKPYYDNQLIGVTRQDSLCLFSQVKNSSQTFLSRKLFNESFVQIDSTNYYLFADPLFNFGLGKEASGRKTWMNSRGFRGGGRLGSSFAFETEFYETQAVFFKAYDGHIALSRIIPGQGLGRRYGTTGWDYSNSAGYVSYAPVSKINLQLGYGKQFIGDGYRSLILSDASFYYPYVKFTFNSRYFMYSWMLASLQEYDTSKVEKNDIFFRKSFSTHLLSFNILKKIQISLIESEIHNNPDTLGRFKTDWRLFNPIMMLYAATPDVHPLWSVNIKGLILPTLCLYNQWAFDNLNGKGAVYPAFQVGMKYFDVFGLKGLFMQAEYNQVAPNTYNSPQQILTWNHYGEPLAHPYGNNFKEYLGFITYTYNRWELSSQSNIVLQLRKTEQDSNPMVATSIPGMAYFANGQKLYWQNFQLTWYMNPKTLMNLSMGCTLRHEDLPGSFSTMYYFYFAFSTSLVNLYYDL